MVIEIEYRDKQKPDVITFDHVFDPELLRGGAETHPIYVPKRPFLTYGIVNELFLLTIHGSFPASALYLEYILQITLNILPPTVDTTTLLV